MSPPPDLGTRNKNLLKQEQEKYWAPVYRETHTHTPDSDEKYALL